MPSRNVLKYDVPETYYHVYARGANKDTIFLDSSDYEYLISLIARYLSAAPAKDRNGVAYPHLYGKLELLTYCLMRNHFHMLLYQAELKSMKTFMQCLMTSYSRYFNKKHGRSGSLFESRYKASMIMDHAYLEHISRYIHLNPREWKAFPYSSLQYYFGENCPQWLKPGRVTELFSSSQDYWSFLEDYEDQKLILERIKHELADAG